jgi:hypothetical protein
MEIFFHDPDDAPLPPDEVHIRKLSADPYPDGRRVRVKLELTPFQRRPDAELVITGPGGETVATASVIETIDPRLDMTLHLRGPASPGTYRVWAKVSYRPEPDGEDGQPDSSTDPDGADLDVDQAETTFELP